MKLYFICSESHKALRDNWFIPTLLDKFELIEHFERASGTGLYHTSDWSRIVMKKAEFILRAIDENPDNAFIYSDCDIQFFGKIEEVLRNAIEGVDLAIQRDDRIGSACTGFFIARGCPAIRALWEQTREAVKVEGRDQLAFNRILRNMRNLSWRYLPDAFFAAGVGLRPTHWTKRIMSKVTGKRIDWEWKPGVELLIPPKMLLHHANSTLGVAHKISQLEYVRALWSASA